MATVITAGFFSRFDEKGRLLDGDGEVRVVFATRGGSRYPGKLRFKGGLCILAAMDRGGDWRNPDDAPLDGIKFLLSVEDEKLVGVAIEDGRVREIDITGAKQKFLRRFAAARGFYTRQRVSPVGSGLDARAIERKLESAALWLTPAAVSHFDPDHFRELDDETRSKLTTAVEEFLKVAKQVPPAAPATSEQIKKASPPFDTIVRILEPYLRQTDEATKIEKVIAGVEFPPWVLNWEYEIGLDATDAPAVWLTLIVDEADYPGTTALKAMHDLTDRILEAFDGAEIDRYPYLHVKTDAEFRILRRQNDAYPA